MFDVFLETVQGLLNDSGFMNMTWQQGVMIILSGVLMYLAIKKGYEPLLLLPIAFGMLLTNLPIADIFHMEFFTVNNVDYGKVLHDGGLLDFLYLGVKLGIYPSLIFLGIGCMTDFGPLIANPKSFLLGAAAQAGIFVTFLGALGISVLIPENAPVWLQGLRFDHLQAAAIAIIGGADGPTAILVAKTLAPELLGSIAVAAYSYMALVPVIQPPIMKALTTKKERSVVMKQLRPVSKTEKIIFPIVVTLIICLVVPDATPLIGMLMLGNLMKESGAVDRLVKTAQNELMNIVTIFLGISVGATTKAEYFLDARILGIIFLGLFAFCVGTAAGVLFGKLMYVVTKGQVNPLIGSAGVSAVPMAARVSQKVGAEANPVNFLLMHAMGPNVAGVIGSAVAAGVLLSIFA